ncbi:hypothetical protein [Haloferax sp. DFSO52]|uniref:DUF7573 domain-containing protein n=1 Tax=Haloferax sp. DFSO52 TaxID=3388505 RepID=UPI003A8A2733
MPNRSLDDFAGGGADEEATEDETSDEQAVSEDYVDTLATYRWTPTGTTCPQCGESVEKTWLDGDEYVCVECKHW